MTKIKIELPASHMANMTYLFTPFQLKKFRSNVLKAQNQPVNSRICGRNFQFRKECINHYDGKKFEGNCYALLTENLLELLDKYIEDNC
ncbi:MAG: hypothetical protein V5786_08030 [Psychromonas sp.]